MAEKPKAESPKIATTNFYPAWALAAKANGMPTPIVPKVPASNRSRGKSWFIIVRPMSIVFAPSPTNRKSLGKVSIIIL
jgi:hypothetical protein